MNATSRRRLLLITALVEVPTGLCLLFLPTVLFVFLLGLDQAASDTAFVGRLAGAALFAIGIASWIARADTLTTAQSGLLAGIFIYNAAAAVLLAYAGAVLNMAGLLLWPAAAIHSVLAVWCLVCLRPNNIAAPTSAPQ
jgi:hypothetical protein